MKVTFLSPAWEDYLYWQKHDKQLLKKINELIKHCYRDPFKG
ncbi:MAG: type II toxin-antitoxin system YoeB family toxin, partial [Cyclobacteriaceae bacterium]|nr:type II toxin-antitoxin system YoeB family toxin [Cyclobacteriaceae bacterium]